MSEADILWLFVAQAVGNGLLGVFVGAVCGSHLQRIRRLEKAERQRQGVASLFGAMRADVSARAESRN